MLQHLALPDFQISENHLSVDYNDLTHYTGIYQDGTSVLKVHVYYSSDNNSVKVKSIRVDKYRDDELIETIYDRNDQSELDMSNPFIQYAIDSAKAGEKVFRKLVDRKSAVNHVLKQRDTEFAQLMEGIAELSIEDLACRIQAIKEKNVKIQQLFEQIKRYDDLDRKDVRADLYIEHVVFAETLLQQKIAESKRAKNVQSDAVNNSPPKSPSKSLKKSPKKHKGKTEKNLKKTSNN